MLCQSSDWSEVTVSPNAPPLTTRVVKGTKPTKCKKHGTDRGPTQLPPVHPP